MLDRLLGTVRSLIPMSSTDPDVPVLDADALDEALSRGESMIVVFYADWCGFSRAFLPIFEERAPELELPPAAANISSESDPRWSTHDVQTVPTLVAFEDGEEVARVDGRPGQGLDESDLDRLLEELEV